MRRVGTACHLLTRVLTRTDSTMAMLFNTALVRTLAFGLTLPWSWDGDVPTLPDVGLLLALGGLATPGHFLFTATYREAPASLLAPGNYMHLFWAGGLGSLVFGHVPDPLSLLGMGFVAGAGVAVALRSQLAQA